MKMNPEEITAIIKDQIKNYAVDLNVDEKKISLSMKVLEAPAQAPAEEAVEE